MAVLGYADEYEAWIVDATTQRNLLRLPWSGIKWQRVSSEISQASVTVANADGGIECCGVIGGLFPFSQFLRIERNGWPVWDGPIIGWSRPRGSTTVTINAKDRSMVFMKRLIAFHSAYTAARVSQIIADTSGGVNNGLGIAQTASCFTGAVGWPLSLYPLTQPNTREDVATREYLIETNTTIYKAFKDLVDATAMAFWTTRTDTCYLQRDIVARFLGIAGQRSTGCPVLSERTVIGLPGVHVDGSGMATDVYCGAAGQGVNGFPIDTLANPAVGIFLPSSFRLQKAAVAPDAGTSTDTALVAAREAALSACPVVTLEQVQLSPDFGCDAMSADLSNLLPGAQLNIDFEETCAFNTPIAEYREAAGVPGLAYMTQISRAELGQIDVTVAKGADGGITEEFLASYWSIISTDVSNAAGLVVS